MSSGCCHPKNLFPALQRVLPTAGFAPLRGTKNPRSRFIHFNSASQSFVSYAVRLSDLPAASTTFCKFFFAAVALSNTFILPVLPESSTGSFYFFSACFRPGQNCLAKNRAHTIAGLGERASVFSKNFHFFSKTSITPQALVSQRFTISIHRPGLWPATGCGGQKGARTRPRERVKRVRKREMRWPG